MTKGVLIHQNNVPNDLMGNFADDYIIDFNYSDSEYNNFDEYISQEILIKKLKKLVFDIIYIKDNLSSNYLELYGLRVAYHIRLSRELDDNQRFIPIVLLSDIDVNTINKLEPMARILFTKNVFLSANNKNTFEKFNIRNINQLTNNVFNNKFLKLIEVKSPENSTNHSIANEWAIYLWAKELKISKSKKINKIIKDLSLKLYFKYLHQKYLIADPIKEIEGEAEKKVVDGKSLVSTRKPLKIITKRKVETKRILLIDDEWDKGWNDIFEHIFPEEKNYNFRSISDIIYNNKKYDDIKEEIFSEIRKYKPDILILDMRLVASDQDQRNDTEKISGLQILKAIKSKENHLDINPGIQVVMLTASGRSDILDIANKENKILGYIKKEHPEDNSSNTKENIDNLAKLVNEGLEKRYLKDIWEIRQRLLKLDILKHKDFKPMIFEIESIFEILDSGMVKRYTYAMLSIFQALEEINNYYINDNTKKWHDGHIETTIEGSGYTKQKIEAVIRRLKLDQDFSSDIDKISKMRKNVIHPPQKGNIEKTTQNDILTWFNMLEIILKNIHRGSE